MSLSVPVLCAWGVGGEGLRVGDTPPTNLSRENKTINAPPICPTLQSSRKKATTLLVWFFTTKPKNTKKRGGFGFFVVVGNQGGGSVEAGVGGGGWGRGGGGGLVEGGVGDWGHTRHTINTGGGCVASGFATEKPKPTNRHTQNTSS